MIRSRNPNNFRFAGVDSRGKQYLVQSPNSNGGIAVIRIEDNPGGMHGYTGDIMWNGGSNNGGGQWPANGGGQWNANVVPNCQNAVGVNRATGFGTPLGPDLRGARVRPGSALPSP